MSIYLNGTTFKDRFVRPIEDAALFRSLVSDGIYSGCAITALGSTLKLAAGRIIACGRCVKVATAQDIAITGETSGYARLVLTIDTSQTATTTEFKQARLDVDYASSLGGFSSLTQDDINGSGTVYQLSIAVVSLSGSGITGIVSTCGPAHGRAAGVTLLLDADDWDANNRQTVRCDGVTSSTKVTATYAATAEDRDVWLNAGIWLKGQGAGTLTFQCDNVPSSDVNANVMLL